MHLNAFKESLGRTTCTCQVGKDTLRWTPGRGLKECCAMSLVLFMACYNVFVKEPRHRHPNVFFLSYVNDLLFVAQDL